MGFDCIIIPSASKQNPSSPDVPEFIQGGEFCGANLVSEDEATDTKPICCKLLKTFNPIILYDFLTVNTFHQLRGNHLWLNSTQTTLNKNQLMTVRKMAAKASSWSTNYHKNSKIVPQEIVETYSIYFESFMSA